MTFAQQPAQDRAVVCMADEVHALHVRRGGAIEFLVRQRLTEEPRGAAGVFVTIDPDLDPSWGRAREQACVSIAFSMPGRSVGICRLLLLCSRVDVATSDNRDAAFNCKSPISPHGSAMIDTPTMRLVISFIAYGATSVRDLMKTRCHLSVAWQDGSLSEQHAIHTLLQILDDGLLH
ncbi:MAG: hypothetical protein U0892_08865 [Pirellulales bacterium]